jgi:hypothetical protein
LTSIVATVLFGRGQKADATPKRGRRQLRSCYDLPACASIPRSTLVCHTLFAALATLQNTAFPTTLNLNHQDTKNTKVHEGRTHPTHAENKRITHPVNRSQIEKSFLVIFFKKEALSFLFFFEKKNQKTVG